MMNVTDPGFLAFAEDVGLTDVVDTPIARQEAAQRELNDYERMGILDVDTYHYVLNKYGLH